MKKIILFLSLIIVFLLTACTTPKEEPVNKKTDLDIIVSWLEAHGIH